MLTKASLKVDWFIKEFVERLRKWDASGIARFLTRNEPTTTSTSPIVLR